MNIVGFYLFSAYLPMAALSSFICAQHRLAPLAFVASLIIPSVYAGAGLRVALHFNKNWFPQPTYMVLRTIGWLAGIGLVFGFILGAILIQIF
jgi:uncharacterized membrane protein (DUF485 family)